MEFLELNCIELTITQVIMTIIHGTASMIIGYLLIFYAQHDAIEKSLAFSIFQSTGAVLILVGIQLFAFAMKKFDFADWVILWWTPMLLIMFVQSRLFFLLAQLPKK